MPEKKRKKERVVSHDRCLLLIAYSFELRSLSELQDIVAVLARNCTLAPCYVVAREATTMTKSFFLTRAIRSCIPVYVCILLSVYICLLFALDYSRASIVKDNIVRTYVFANVYPIHIVFIASDEGKSGEEKIEKKTIPFF